MVAGLEIVDENVIQNAAAQRNGQNGIEAPRSQGALL
jgi:hypothetical protein